eukprot:6190893-Pleurochrysis_carterae.AAC.3
MTRQRVRKCKRLRWCKRLRGLESRSGSRLSTIYPHISAKPLLRSEASLNVLIGRTVPKRRYKGLLCTLALTCATASGTSASVLA